MLPARRPSQTYLMTLKIFTIESSGTAILTQMSALAVEQLQTGS
jgi:hypothetical protein